MAYNLNQLLLDAINLLEKDETLVTDLQLYGRLGVSHKYYYEVMARSDQGATIEAMLRSNKAKGSTIATDCLRKAAMLGDVKAATTYGRIVDGQICKALAPNAVKEDEISKAPTLSKEEMANEVMRLFEQNGFH